MRIIEPWIDAPETQTVCRMLTAAGWQALFVGGCVRNALLAAPVSDIDIATDALPEQVMALAKQAGFHAIPTGIDHGTVTVVVNHHPFEITTFRHDVETDGRRAVVAYTTDPAEDAHRRDFTMNALYARPDGKIIDPLGGLPDLLARRVRFIDDAGARIREDYLRILRFFRFHAWYGRDEDGLDAEGLAACAALSGGIETLSKERVGAEMKKLLAAPDPAPSTAAMAQSGVLTQILPGADVKALAPLVHLEGEHNVAPSAIRRLAAIAGANDGIDLRLSRDEARGLAQLRHWVGTGDTALTLGYRLGAEAGRDVILLRGALLEMPLPGGWQGDLATGAAAEFPVKAADLMPAFSGAALGAELKRIEDRWIASGLVLTRAELLG